MEIIVALTILSVVLIALGGLMFQVSQQTRRSMAETFMSAAMQKYQTRLEGLPWDSLASDSALVHNIEGCAVDTTGQLVFTACTQVTDTGGLARIQVTLTPTGNLVARPETLLAYRAKPQPISPFKP
jgi:hypothetical protein